MPLQVATNSFKAAYTDLTGREWKKNYEKVMEMTNELTAFSKKYGAGRAVTSGRGKKSEVNRQ